MVSGQLLSGPVFLAEGGQLSMGLRKEGGSKVEGAGLGVPGRDDGRREIGQLGIRGERGLGSGRGRGGGGGGAVPVREAPLPKISQPVRRWQLFANPGGPWPESVLIPHCSFMIKIEKARFSG